MPASPFGLVTMQGRFV